MTAHAATPAAPDSRFLRAAALTAGLGALIFVLTSLAVAAGLIPMPRPSPPTPSTCLSISC